MFNRGGLYDPLRMETVLRVSFPKIGDYERKQGMVVPRARQGLSGGKSSGRTVFRKKDGQYDKPRDTKPFKDTHEVHECDDVLEDSEAENEEDEQIEVYLEDQSPREEQE